LGEKVTGMLISAQKVKVQSN